jgi:energy-coupling factor transport system permease protein
MMPVPVPFGQFVAAESPVHRLDARVKIVVAVVVTIALFVVSEWSALAVIAVASVAAIGIARVPMRLALRGLRPVALLLAFTLTANALWPAVRTEALFALGPLAVDSAGLMRGAFFATRILLLVFGTSLVTLTTSPVALTDAFAQMMRPLARLHFPVDDAAMMMSIALRFMPTTAEEAERIIVAQTARGARFDAGGPLKRARSWMPVLIPLFVRLFRRADDLAVAMEARCYRGAGRTRLREARMRPADWIALTVGVTAGLALAILA